MNVQSRLEWPQPFAASVTTQRLRFDVEPDLPVSVLNFVRAWLT